MTPHVSALTVYPVKSFAGYRVDEVVVGPEGPSGDRRWMLVDERGETLTARKLPQMLGARALPVGHGVALDHATLGLLEVAAPFDGRRVDVTMSRVEHATDAGDDAAAWCSELVGRPARLVWLDDPSRRGMSAAHGGTADDPMSLTDTAPLHLFTTASLRRLDQWAAQAHDEAVERALAAGRPVPDAAHPLDVRRFRPNILVDGVDEPFAEDDWSRFVVGGLELRFADHTGRCVMTTVDPDTYLKGKEPLRSLARHRRRDGEVWFGIQAVPVRTGVLRVGDRVSAS
ncbi:MOSC domain-containing protein [Cellulomonas sp. HZM]|uniref:MOSC domain-containing protein n=1 Tax=Cellulomonas sp. HZM TaxID=1454010 RepID=UPI0004931E1F|nr:MOSC N-terminal beta barrel domain-containing protein [Cellulomonas sp. HZM]